MLITNQRRLPRMQGWGVWSFLPPLQPCLIRNDVSVFHILTYVNVCLQLQNTNISILSKHSYLKDRSLVDQLEFRKSFLLKRAGERAPLTDATELAFRIPSPHLQVLRTSFPRKHIRSHRNHGSHPNSLHLGGICRRRRPCSSHCRHLRIHLPNPSGSLGARLDYHHYHSDFSPGNRSSASRRHCFGQLDHLHETRQKEGLGNTGIRGKHPLHPQDCLLCALQLGCRPLPLGRAIYLLLLRRIR